MQRATTGGAGGELRLRHPCFQLRLRAHHEALLDGDPLPLVLRYLVETPRCEIVGFARFTARAGRGC